MKNTRNVLIAQGASGAATLGVTVRVGVFFDGTGNNRSNSQIGADCRAMAEISANKHIAECGGRHSDPNSSYSNDLSNIARLADLYCNRPVASNLGDGLKVYWPIYVSGIGTLSGGRDSVWPGQSFGRGRTGVISKVSRAVEKLGALLTTFSQHNPGCFISTLELDVFGFSRGAAAARHFANEVLKEDKGELEPMLNRRRVPLSPGFSWQNGSVRMKVIGLFDTVAAVGGIRDMGNLGDAHNDKVNLYLPPGCAEQVLHLVARDEERRNFALNSVLPHWPMEIVLPGVHSDIGGGYHPQMIEKVLLTRPIWSFVEGATPNESTQAWQQAFAEMKGMDQAALIDPKDAEASLSIACKERPTKGPYNRGVGKAVMAAVCLQRQVFGHLSRVHLRVMHALACDEGVPFNPIPGSQDFLILPELQGVARKLIAYARGAAYSLDAEEEQMLRHRYIHRSAHWDALIDSRHKFNDALFVHAPQSGGRVRWPNQEGRG
ncbi:T6SS phospholipase effector Tle1-like catalytic domain-containing protein [Pseudomonas sp. ICMP 561]|uniref:T6SS phospholipase effector Tle1-like catalytic domain-containing protein n=1 Tax=Pseudomonas sp. ICMP 561 TaxID=1718918 RepID=UPI000C0896D0|nr:DUF2235 domain-containing protein [Pseudomonas sp. ICMP 561]PHN25270.1 hypothetical protein AO242_13490 [Pseudomonas sp. ICMP 561]